MFPLKNKKFKSSKTLMGLANAFSGGIFIAAGILHVLPDANEAYEAGMKKKGVTDDYFPWPNLMCILSFSLVFLVDKVVFDPHQLLHAGHDHGHGHSHGHGHHQHNDEEKDYKDEYDNDDDAQPKARSLSHSHLSDKLVEAANPEGQLDLNASYYPYILVLAMGIHAAFTGLALGIFDEASGFYGFFLAIVLHKWAEALTIGISFSKSNITKKRSTIMVIIFALATPIGALIGVLLNGANDIVKGILLAVSAGTFIYIAATEIIVEEFAAPGGKGWKFLLYLIGIGFMVFLWFLELWTEGDDDDKKGKLKAFM
jgi:zinc transporter 1/2/3